MFDPSTLRSEFEAATLQSRNQPNPEAFAAGACDDLQVKAVISIAEQLWRIPNAHEGKRVI